ncbi:MAG: glycosyltransferase family 4 protein [Phycisphaerae bacterium]
MPDKTQPRIAMIGSYVPRRCGIATFTRDLATAIARTGHGQALSGGNCVQIVAMNDRYGEYTYSSEVTVEIGQHRREDYRNAAEILNTSRMDAVSLQHEFGLFGGECGDYLFELITRLRKPLVSTLHSVVSEPSPKQRDVLQRLCAKSSTVVVMANHARMLLQEKYDVPLDHIRLIHHGVPDVPFGDSEPFKERFGLVGRPMILTFGLLGPGKGIEVMLDALAKVVHDHPDVAYVVLGVTHPAIKRESGELYRISLERRAVELGIQKNVLFHNRYVSYEDLLEYLQAADIYATPYRNKEQITSGTLAYALACGRAIVSTPYWYAQELLANGRGRLVDFGDAAGFANALRELLEDEDARMTVRRVAYHYGREMIWPRVAEQYFQAFADARETFAERAREVVAERKVLMRLSLPEHRLDHLFTMTDDTGMLQHSIYATPDRRHGYCSDDNARALIVASMAWSLFQDEQVLPYLHIYLSFLHYAQRLEGGRFRNFMSYDRRWLEEDGNDDCQGRILWALGYLISHAPNDSTKRLATDLFRGAVSQLDSLRSPRSWALGILGLHYYLRAFGDDVEVRSQKARLADRLNAVFAEHESDDWPWFEDVVTYDNGRLPQALIIAGHQLGRQELVDRGLRALRWLFEVQTAREGHLSIIGSDGWLHRTGERAQFDQQPLEPAALISACKAAYRASGDPHWLVEMRRAFEWYIGRNDLGLFMVDFKSRGCYDGLEASGVNENQGAESILSWLLSLLTMHEMQTGDAPEVG